MLFTLQCQIFEAVSHGYMSMYKHIHQYRKMIFFCNEFYLKNKTKRNVSTRFPSIFTLCTADPFHPILCTESRLLPIKRAIVARVFVMLSLEKGRGTIKTIRPPPVYLLIYSPVSTLTLQWPYSSRPLYPYWFIHYMKMERLEWVNVWCFFDTIVKVLKKKVIKKIDT